MATKRSRSLVISALGIGQVFSWGSSYYLPAVLAKPIVSETGWPLAWVVAGLTIASLTAGLISTRVGHAIHVHGGRPAIMFGAVLLAAGLAFLGLSPNLPLYLCAWVVIGVGMGCSLYDAAFATLGKLYGQDARRAITHLTLFGGLASTVCWPLSAVFLEHLGWRGTCFAYAALHLGLTLPIYGFVLPAREPPDSPQSWVAQGMVTMDILPSRQWRLFSLMAAVFSIGWGISSVVSVHLLAILQTRGLDVAAAVALGALVGPSQVGGRVFEMVLGKHYRPIHTLLISVALVASGLCLLAIGVSMVPIALVIYGAGVGISSIARGTLPLAVFGPERYPMWVGRLARPALIAGAVSPLFAAMLLENAGTTFSLSVLFAAAVANIGIALLLWSMCQKRPVAENI